jgi:drug/metabolite transporter (DMT)-like permease
LKRRRTSIATRLEEHFFSHELQVTKAEHIGWSSALIALFVSALWGGNVIALKLGLATVPPLWSAFWRFLSGFVAVLIWAKFSGIQLMPEPGESRPLTILGLMFTLQIMGLNLGVNATSPAYAVILLNSHPLFTNLVSHFFVPEDRLSRQRILGLAIAFAGICYLAMGRPDARLAPHPILGNVIVVISASLLAIRMVYTQRLVQKMDPVRPVIWQMGFSLPIFLATAAWFEPTLLKPLTAEPVIAILYQGIAIGGFCFVVWTRLLKRHSPGSLSVFGFSVPVFGVILSAYIFGETITGRVVAGMAAVTAGIVIVTRRRGKELEAEDSVEEAIEEVLR